MADIDDLPEDRISELLRSVTEDDSLRAPGRADIRARFLDEFDGTAPTSVPAVELDLRNATKQPHRASAVMLAVASVLVVVGAIGVFLAGRAPVDEPVPATPMSAPPATPTETTTTSETTTRTTVPQASPIDEAAAGTALAAGWHLAPLAGGTRFELLEPTILERSTDDRLVLLVSAERQDDAVVSIIDADPSTFRSALTDLVGQGEVSIDPDAYRVDSLSLELSPDAADARGCAIDAVCTIDELSIEVATGGDTQVTIVEFADGGGVIVVERFAGPGTPVESNLADGLGVDPDAAYRLRDVAAGIIDTIEPAR